MAPPRSPSSRPAGRFRRAAALVIDGFVGFLLTVALSSTVGMYFARRAVVMLHIGEPDTLWQGPVPLMLGAVGEVVYLLPFALWLIWLLDPLTGGTPGKRALRLRICTTAGELPTTKTLWQRHIIQTVGLWGTSLALVVGIWQIAVLALAADLVVGMGRLHDRLTATHVGVRRPSSDSGEPS